MSIDSNEYLPQIKQPAKAFKNSILFILLSLSTAKFYYSRNAAQIFFEFNFDKWE